MAGYGYVRARGAYQFNNNGRSARFVKGDVVRADHWAVDENPERFDHVDDHDPAVVAIREAARAELQERVDRAGTHGTESVADQQRADRERLFPNAHLSPSGPGSRSRDIARRSVDGLHRNGSLPGHAAERVEQLLTRTGRLRDQNAAAAWVNAAGNPHYRTAFAKMLANPERGHMLWTVDEQRAYQAVEEYRGMSSVDADGGYLVPLTLDPSIMLTNDGTTNPLRAVSRVVQTATDSWKGITSAGATAEWLPESTEAADGSPTIDQPNVPVHKHSVFVPYSYEVGQDAVDFLGQLAVVMSDALAVLQADAYTTGDGVNKPTGFVPGATAVNSDTANTFALADVYATQEALPPRFQGNATWAAPLGTLNQIAQFETTNGAPALPMTDGRLLRKSVVEVSDMTATFTTGGLPLVYGDFRQFVIADRIGSTVELIPNLLGANRRPTGERGVYLHARTGSDVVVPEALRVLTIG